MRKNYTRRGFYSRYQNSPLRHAMGGRTGHNMSVNKVDEYTRLIYYIKYNEINPYGYIPVLSRFHKNLKRRKTWIRLYKQNSAT